MKYKQVIVCALGLLVGMTQLVWGEFKNPEDSAPDGKRDAGSRGRNNLPELCPQMKKPLLALIPQTNLGYTLASHPTFWLYIPGYSDSINFTLKDKDTGEEIYQTKFNVESEEGIISLKLPSFVPRLKLGKEYRWRFVFNCRNEPKNLSVEGVVARKATTENLTSQLNSAATVMEMIDIYEENGLWHETITTLGNLRRSYPDNVAIAARWKRLLERDDIRFPNYDLTDKEIQYCCNIGDQ